MTSKIDKCIEAGATGNMMPGSNKREFHDTATRVLKAVAQKTLKLNTSDYDLRSNAGGSAVTGEITLHTDHLYISVLGSCVGPSNKATVLVRRCQSRKDFAGEQNTYCPAEVLEKPKLMDEWLQRRMLTTYDEDRFGVNGVDLNFMPAER